MIITLKGADFSANNIGAILKPITPEMLNYHTKAVLNGDDGSLITDGTADYMVVSDFITIPTNAVISEFGAITTTTLGNTAYCVFYDKNKTFISSVLSASTGTSITGTWKYMSTLPEIPEGAKYIRVAFNTGLAGYSSLDICQREYALLNFYIMPNSNTMMKHTCVTLNGDDGSLVDKGTDKQYFVVSDYIEVPSNSSLTQFVSITHKDEINAYCVFYDENKVFISSYKPTSSDTSLISEHRYTTTPPAIPEGTKYIRVAFNNGLVKYGVTNSVAKRNYALIAFA